MCPPLIKQGQQFVFNEGNGSILEGLVSVDIPHIEGQGRLYGRSCHQRNFNNWFVDIGFPFSFAIYGEQKKAPHLQLD